ncbi:hypothetical protein BDAP_002680 [Binucleata daphniae]
MSYAKQQKDEFSRLQNEEDEQRQKLSTATSLYRQCTAPDSDPRKMTLKANMDSAQSDLRTKTYNRVGKQNSVRVALNDIQREKQELDATNQEYNNLVSKIMMLKNSQ